VYDGRVPALNSESNSSAFPAGAGQFATTHWSVVLAAKERDSPVVQEAVEKLCRTDLDLKACRNG